MKSLKLLFCLQVFAYNATEDRLELCLEPHGHYAIEPNIEQKVLSASSLPKSHLVGSSGDQAVSSSKKCQQAHVPFSGQGHSMLSSNDNISMPHDLDMAPHGHKVSKLSHFSGTMPHPASIREEEDEQNAAGTAMETEPTFKRVGPGCTVLDTDTGGGGAQHNTTSPDTFRTLASQIRDIVARTETDLQEEEEEGARAEVREGVRAEVREGVRAEVREGVRAEVREGVRAEVREGVRAEVREGVRAEVREGVRAEVREGVRAEVREGDRAEVREGVRAGVREGDRAGVREGVRAGVREGDRAGVREGVRAEVREGVRAEVREGVRAEVREGDRAGVREGDRAEVREGVRAEVREGVRAEVREGVRAEVRE